MQLTHRAKALLCVACFGHTSLQVILMRYASKNLTFSHSFTTWAIEVFKLLLSISVWFYQGHPKIKWRLGWVSYFMKAEYLKFGTDMSSQF